MRSTSKYDPQLVQERGARKLAEKTAEALNDRALTATAMASLAPTPERHPPDAANDGRFSTMYSPGDLTRTNDEWIELKWKDPQRIKKVVASFAQHPSMHGRTIHLQQESAAGSWHDIATATIPNDGAAVHALATIELPKPIEANKIRLVNLFDLNEIEVY